MKNLFAMLACLFFCALCIAPLTAHAHHSYAPYDIDTVTELEGRVSSYRFAGSHPVIMLDVVSDEGAVENWYIEGPSMRHWNEHALPRDIADDGEAVVIRGWASRDGSSKMLLSSIDRESGETIVILDRVRQPQALAAAARYRAEAGGK